MELDGAAKDRKGVKPGEEVGGFQIGIGVVVAEKVLKPGRGNGGGKQRLGEIEVAGKWLNPITRPQGQLAGEGGKPVRGASKGFGVGRAGPVFGGSQGNERARKSQREVRALDVKGTRKRRKKKGGEKEWDCVLVGDGFSREDLGGEPRGKTKMEKGNSPIPGVPVGVERQKIGGWGKGEVGQEAAERVGKRRGW